MPKTFPIKPCATCGTEFQATGPRSKYCTPACKPGCYVGTCEHCGVEFTTDDPRAKMCSQVCWKASGGPARSGSLKGGVAASPRGLDPVPRADRPAGKVDVICTTCGKEFQKWAANVARQLTDRHFCSRECQHAAGSKPRRGEMVPCHHCAQDFYRSPASKAIYCSRTCKDEAAKTSEWEHRTCEHCAKGFDFRLSMAKWNAGRFCSTTCEAAYRRVKAVGKRRKRSDGYIEVFLPDHPTAQPSNGCVLEHRLVMEQHLGRPLRPGENVHHANGKRDDNRLENLELWEFSQPSGQRVADKLAWARELLAKYGDEVLVQQ